MDSGSITRLIQDAGKGLAGAEDQLFERVFEELKAMAASRVANERASPSAASPTELVHEAYQRLAGEEFENRRHLFFAYARSMRQILIDRARKRRTDKRDDGRVRVPLDGADVADPAAVAEGAQGAQGAQGALDAIDVDALVDRVRGESAREADVVLLRFFGGLRDADIAEILGVDARTVRRDWASAKAKCLRWSKRGG